MQIKSITIQIKDKELTFTLEELLEFKKKTDEQLECLKQLFDQEAHEPKSVDYFKSLREKQMEEEMRNIHLPAAVPWRKFHPYEVQPLFPQYPFGMPPVIC